jgi:hypothetical protein
MSFAITYVDKVPTVKEFVDEIVQGAGKILGKVRSMTA